MASTSRITLAPVVVYPDIISNIASVKPIGFSHVMNGMIPNRPNTTHMEAVIMNPSRALIDSLRWRVANIATEPIIAAAQAAIRNDSQSDSP